MYVCMILTLVMRYYSPLTRLLGFFCSLFPATTGNYAALGSGIALRGAGSFKVRVAAKGKGPQSKELV